MSLDKIPKNIKITSSLNIGDSYLGYTIDSGNVILVTVTVKEDILKAEEFYKKCFENEIESLLYFNQHDSKLLLSICISQYLIMFDTLKSSNDDITNMIFKSLNYYNIIIEEVFDEKMMFLLQADGFDNNYVDINFWKKWYKIYNRNKIINDIMK